MGIKTRLSIAILGVVAAAIPLTGGWGLLTLRSVISSTEEELASHARAVFFRAVERQSSANEVLARLLAESPGVQERMRNNDRLGLLSDLAPTFATLKAYGINNVHFHRPNTTTLARLHAPNQYDDDLSALRPMIAEVNRTRTARQGIELGVNGLPIRGAVPVTAPDGRSLGVVEIGSFINAEFLRGIAEADVLYTVYFSGPGGLQRLSGTSDSGATHLSAEDLAKVFERGDVTVRTTAGGMSRLCTVTVLPDYAGRSVGVLQVDIDTTGLEGAYDTAIRRFLIGILLLGLVAASVAALTALGILRPLSRLIRSVELIATNASAPSVPFIGRSDELGRFARAIDEFRNSKSRLQAQAAELDELSRRYAAEREAAVTAMRLLQDVIDTVPAVINFKDLNLRYVFVNRQCARLYDSTHEAMIGKRTSDMNPDYDRTALEKAERQALETGEAEGPHEVSGINPGRGRLGAWWIVKVPFRDPEGKIVGLVTVAVDVTDIKSAQSVLERRQVDLEEANRLLTRQAADLERLNVRYQAERKTAQEASRAKSEFLATMSHELRTPLNAVIGYSEIMLKQMFGPMLPRYLEYTNDILTSGRHLLEVINEILDMSRIESGTYNLNLQAMDVGPIVESAVRFMRERAQAKKQELRLTVAGALPPTMVESRALRQIMLNLIGNAVKFTQPSGRIDIEIRCEAGRQVEISVRDNGPGIEARHLPHVTKPFWQAEEARHRTHEGTGLGLSISNKLVELHGGSLEVASTVGEGTSVTVRLSAAETAVSADSAVASGESRKLSRPA